MKRWTTALIAAAVVVAVLTTVLVTIIWVAPAQWAAQWLAQQTHLRLVNAQGTLWQGSGQMALSDGRQAVMVPGNVSWTIAPWAAVKMLLGGQAQVDVQHPTLLAPLALKLSYGQVQVAAGRASIPATMLMVLGAPFNTVKPGGDLQCSWQDLVINGKEITGAMTVDWNNAHSALSVVAPLGSYRLTLVPQAQELALTLSTVQGPLMLQANGSVRAGKVQLTGQAWAQESMREPLAGLIGVLGPRTGNNGERASLRIGQ